MSGFKRLLFVGLLTGSLGSSVFAVQAETVSVDLVESARASWLAEFPYGDFDRQLAYQRHFRSQFDFMSSEDRHLADVMAQPAENDAMDRWGLKMTTSEYAEMDRRQRIQEEFPEIAAAAVGDGWSEELLEGLRPDLSFGAFAGRWIDQQEGGRLTVALVPDHPDYVSARQRAEAARDALVLDGRLNESDVHFVDVEFSADDLYRVNREFGELYLTEELRGKVVMSASMNPVANRVDLVATPGWEKEAIEFAARYPASLVNIVIRSEAEMQWGDDVAPRDDWGAGNWHAGAAIIIRDGNSTFIKSCSWGATARTVSYVYVVTAAHCLGYGNGTGQAGWFNDQEFLSQRRGVKTYSGGDVLSDANAHTYVLVYHGTRGDLARLSISHPGNTHDYDCYLKDNVICSKQITRRETTTETEIGDVKCMAYAVKADYFCGTINDNDAEVPGYDYLRQVNLGFSNTTDDGDSGGGWTESSLMTGIHKGSWICPNCDAFFTHAYYVETSGYLAAQKICGTSGICS